LRCFISRRFDVDALVASLTQADFTVEQTFVAPDSISALATVG
jgi:hypothetical protein